MRGDDDKFLAQARARRLALCAERERLLAKWRATFSRILANHPGVRKRLIARGRFRLRSEDA